MDVRGGAKLTDDFPIIDLRTLLASGEIRRRLDWLLVGGRLVVNVGYSLKVVYGYLAHVRRLR